MKKNNYMSGFVGGHILQEYNQELVHLHRLTLEMGGVLEQRLADWMQAAQNADTATLQRIVQSDDEIDRYEDELDERCMQIIAKHMPAARDLRLIMAVHKAAVDLERIGDELQKVAKTTLREQARILITELLALASLVANILKESLDVFARMDSARVESVLRQDETIDKQYKAMMMQIDTFLETNQSGSLLDTAVIARSLERIGDHAKNISEYVTFMVDAENIRHRGT